MDFPMPVLSSAPKESNMEKSLHQHLVKTKICSYFSKGACHYGDDCAFAHSTTELKNTPNLRKTRICKAFVEGRCYNKNCNFAHGERELVKTELFHKKSLCVWHEKGSCRNGYNCRFAHGVAELRRPSGSVPQEHSSMDAQKLLGQQSMSVSTMSALSEVDNDSDGGSSNSPALTSIVSRHSKELPASLARVPTPPPGLASAYAGASLMPMKVHSAMAVEREDLLAENLLLRERLSGILPQYNRLLRQSQASSSTHDMADTFGPHRGPLPPSAGLLPLQPPAVPSMPAMAYPVGPPGRW